jgi:hypothetical protein
MGFFYPQWQKIIRIGVTTPPSTTGYQVRVVITWQPGMRDDFADLRFSDYYRTLPYWIETGSVTNRVTATVWIKLTEINSAANEFFCYYGNGGAVSESNGDDVFVKFDDFPGTSLDSNKWSTAAGTPTVSNSICTIVPQIQLHTPAGAGRNLTTNTTCEFRLKFSATVNAEGDLGFFDMVDDFAIFYNSMNLDTFSTYTKVSPNAERQEIGTTYHGSYYNFKIERVSTTSVKFYMDNILKKTHTTRVPTGSNHALFFYAYSGVTYYLDWVFTRPYQATEPTCTPAESGINTAFYQALLRAKHVFDVATYPYTLAVSFVTDHMHLTWTEP